MPRLRHIVSFRRKAPPYTVRTTDGDDVQEEEDEPAPKRKKKTSVAAREWEHNFALLEAFRRREGHADVPPGYKVGGTALRVWLDNQRTRWQAREWSEKTRFYEKRSAMSDEELARLEALGVRWPRANSRAAVFYR